ncbi:hypothetical protein Ct9H90mP29_10620 [bacterium]|nr:MAG: hypothetical protein Ct9H90mP29_10620 [bacterium]
MPDTLDIIVASFTSVARNAYDISISGNKENIFDNKRLVLASMPCVVTLPKFLNAVPLPAATRFSMSI